MHGDAPVDGYQQKVKESGEEEAVDDDALDPLALCKEDYAEELKFLPKWLRGLWQWMDSTRA